MTQKVGYTRVWSAEDDLDQHVQELSQEGCARVFTDRAIGNKQPRPGFTGLLASLSPGDTLVAFRLSHLGRSGDQLASLIKTLVRRKIRVQSIKDGFDTKGPASHAMVATANAFADLDREATAARTLPGLEAAKRHGNPGGRPRALTTEHLESVATLRAQGKSLNHIAAVLEVSKSTVARAARVPKPPPL